MRKFKDKLLGLCNDIVDYMSVTNQRLDQIDSRQSQQTKHMQQISTTLPLRLELSDEQLGQIIERFNNPLMIPAHIGELTKQIGQFGGFEMRYVVGSAKYIQIITEIRPDGTIFMRLTDMSGQTFWTGVWKVLT